MKAQKLLPTGEVIVLVDYRELRSTVARELYDMGIKLKPLNLPVADFQASDRVGIERKTIGDFLQSVIDGRLFEQARALTDTFEKPLLILEGEEDIFEARNIHENAILGAMGALTVDYRLPVLRTKDTKETAKYIGWFATREQLDFKREVQIRGDKRTMDVEAWQEYLVAGLPGVGSRLAKGLLKEFGCVEKVFCATETELKKVEKIGDKKAKEIRKVVSSPYAGEKRNESP